MQSFPWGIVASSIVFLTATAASAADPAVVCHSGKLKMAGKYAACRLNAEAKGIKKSSTPDYSKCESVFSDKWLKAETKAGIGICVTEGDQATLEQRTTWHADAVATALTGGVPVDPYSPASGQTTSYGAGSDGDTQAGATLAYQDNGDGTITDLNTGLMWEKKILQDGVYTDCSATEAGACANPHDSDNYYDWSDGPCCSETDYDGGAVTIFLNQLNNRCNDDTAVACVVDADCAVPGGPCGFAGHQDWRLPNLKELVGLVDYERVSPSIDPAFDGANCGALCADITDPACSCTQSDFYWSSTTYQYTPSYAWDVYFYDGDTGADVKTNGYFVRAVRSGS